MPRREKKSTKGHAKPKARTSSQPKAKARPGTGKHSVISWPQATREAIERLTTKQQKNSFTRVDLIDIELDTIVQDTGSKGKTPKQTLSRVLQQLRDNGEIKFLDNLGKYEVCI